MAPGDLPVRTVAAVGAALMTAPVRLYREPTKAICGDCSGKGFDPRHRGCSRRCQRCRGKGHTLVGSTKR